MGRWTYYSPIALGALLVVVMNDSLRAALPTMEPWVRWLVVVGVAVAAGLQSQVLMTGAQGAFAQVLPVPWGRSIRGRGATLAGWLLILWVALSAVTVLLAFEAVTRAAVVLGVISAAALAAATVVYVWNIPAAVEDFGREGRA